MQNRSLSSAGRQKMPLDLTHISFAHDSAMQLDTRPSAPLLASLAEEVVELLKAGKFDELANRFAYALKYDRDTTTAIREDLTSSLRNLGASSLSPTKGCSVPTVQYFAPNTTHLVAAVSCVAYAENGTELLVSLIVTGDTDRYFVTLEDMYAPPAE